MIKAWITIGLLVSTLVAGLSQVSFYAESDSKEVVQGGNFRLSFTIENADPSILPQFKLDKNFRILSGPSTSSNLAIVNGKKSSKKSFSYVVQSQSLGIHKIPAATIKVGSKTYTSKPIIVKTVKGKPGGGSAVSGAVSSSDIFVRVEVSDSSAYVGQQVTLKYVMYTNKDVKTYDIKNESDYDGFYVSKVNNYRDRATNVVIDGRQYRRQSLKTIILFPQQSGSYTIDATTIDLGLPDPNRKKQTGFFFSSRTIPFRVVTNPVNLKVKSSPPNAPVSFSGAIGRYDMTSKIDKRRVSTDDAITVVMTVTGVGDGKFIEAAKQPPHNSFDFYDPNTLSDDSYERGDEIMVSKSFEYLIVPKKVGTQYLRPEFTYFDIDSSKYITLYGDQYRIDVIKGTGVTKETFQRDDIAEFNGLMETTRLKNRGGRFMFSPLYWGMMILPLLGFFGVYIQRRKQIELEGIDPLVARQAAAKNVALGKLAAAKEAMNASKNRLFYEEINKGLYGYMSDRLFVPASELNRSNIEEKLLSKNVTPDLKDKFISIINACQQAMYAGQAQDSLASIYDEAVDTIIKLENHLGEDSV